MVVYNPLGWERSGDVSVRVQGRCRPDGDTLHATISDVPALGYKVVRSATALIMKGPDGNETASES